VTPFSNHPAQRVALFGGSFNPIHFGHLRSAEEVREAFALDRIYFIPAARPPHKPEANLVAAVHRLRMVELAVADNPFFSASPIEIERQGPSYSIDTIRHFLTTLPSVTLFFIVGFDAFCDIHTWKGHQDIPTLCNLIITSRPGVPMPPQGQQIPVALRSVFCYDPAKGMYIHPSGHTLVFHELIGLQLSSSQIRNVLRHSCSARYLVPPAVESYIAVHVLYRAEREEP
jgi:nicotinate-nucleotide adenylyltransferase